MCPGGAPGEVYIAAFDTGYCYSLFSSTDYGQHFSFRYRLPFFFFFSIYRLGFQAGRAEGEFYIFIEYDQYYNGDITLREKIAREGVKD